MVILTHPDNYATTLIVHRDLQLFRRRRFLQTLARFARLGFAETLAPLPSEQFLPSNGASQTFRNLGSHRRRTSSRRYTCDTALSGERPPKYLGCQLTARKSEWCGARHPRLGLASASGLCHMQDQTGFSFIRLSTRKFALTLANQNSDRPISGATNQ